MTKTGLSLADGFKLGHCMLIRLLLELCFFGFQSAQFSLTEILINFKIIHSKI